MNLEQIVFTIISHAGNARSICFDALKHAKEGNFVEAENCLNKASEELLEAHHVQTDMIHKEAQGEKQEVTLLLIHAEDHLMNAILAKELITEMIELYKIIYQTKGATYNV
ncbi:phosphotransferase system PTS lactose/cellobiose-specific IIA subunit [Thermoanaerobacter mathranii subsp. mathranii str. A3]|jgi:PTS system cellobiose-specific IIA component|uniref:Phosphotransferase system PTS, lactose/cellobiose-specific IIA subunit n=3 Tax=Thermoanaerobacter TaxID=1754 RepID=B0KCW9_THEP3|nr:MULTISPECIES: PTS lactose/cellobiose transporter subunit IIA [Thermoanaerobacter]MDI3478514.1 cellobiose system component [Thermoanaerobacterium sp.]HAE62915.1 PTS lactose/cellobiose transporter subunit IIA [Eubacteriaceae bacterium]ABY95576.1 phosphotransferase system PTS, lactose/cellobiose-specific IIA subunit [Thermoanaerobacter pseudethanolicus ATCC 33223]ADH60149.1 phosphotransferase system PTS lactose/cellobiose-specific IIA subunit [Thermoanaerobacter mathranii subsp. mathranii str. 